jgi:hypothetical protein
MPARTMAEDDATLTLVGGPTVLIDIDGCRLLTDPTFDAPGRYPAGPAGEDRRPGAHRRFCSVMISTSTTSIAPDGLSWQRRA